MAKNKNWQRREAEPTIIENTAIQIPEEHQPLEKETAESFDKLAELENNFDENAKTTDELLNGIFPSDSMASVPKDGTRIYLASESGENFILGYWKQTRTITKANRFKWLVGGKWVDAFGRNLGFEPKYWKDA